MYHDVKSVIQDGPQCGLVALCMAARPLKRDELSVESVVSTAQDMGFTKLGEMFSASNMCSLASKLLNCNGLVLPMSSETCLMKLFAHSHCAWLVPYDKDRNHAPCCRNGHSAHWALVSGVAGLGKRDSNGVEVLCNACKRFSNADIETRDLDVDEDTHHLDKITDASSEKSQCSQGVSQQLKQPLTEDSARAILSLNHVYVFANQGKSIHTHLWSLSDLVKSNHQLKEVDPGLGAGYVLGKGIASGLCSQAVFLWTE